MPTRPDLTIARGNDIERVKVTKSPNSMVGRLSELPQINYASYELRMK